jgi:hypothetical protein
MLNLVIVTCLRVFLSELLKDLGVLGSEAQFVRVITATSFNIA